MPHDTPKHEADAQRMQVGAAVVLGFVMLAVIVVRAWFGNVLSPHWWRPW